jgi:DNA-binding CsgD family transcriptional regulator
MISVAVVGEPDGLLERISRVLSRSRLTVLSIATEADVVVILGEHADASPRDVVVAVDKTSFWAAIKSAGGVVMVDRLDTLPQVVRAVAAGYRCLPGLSDIESMFSPEEMNLTRLMRDGATDDEIGAAVGYSRRQAQRLVHELLAELGVTSRHEALLLLGALSLTASPPGGPE